MALLKLGRNPQLPSLGPMGIGDLANGPGACVGTFRENALETTQGTCYGNLGVGEQSRFYTLSKTLGGQFSEGKPKLRLGPITVVDD